MSKHSSVIAKSLLFSIFALFVFAFSNRHLVAAQDSDSTRHKAVKITVSATGVIDDDDVIAHKGDTIEFCPEKPGGKFSIVFTKSPFEPQFPNGKTAFDDRDCGSPQTVGHKIGDHARAYDFHIGAGTNYVDPHIIIM